MGKQNSRRITDWSPWDAAKQRQKL